MSKRKISIVWSVEDVIDRAKDTGVKITEEQAMKVLELMKRKHDCEVGINWDVVDSHIDTVVCGFA